MRRQHPRPVGLKGRGRRERRVRARRREEHEQRRARRRLDLGGIEARHGELIGDRPPAERRPLVGERLAVVDGVEPVEDALGPALLQPRHHGDRSIPPAPERGNQRVALRAHEQHVGVFIPDFEPRQQADVGQPRIAAEGRRLDERRHDVAPGVADVCFETRPLGGNRSREVGVVPADRAVGLDEDQQHVGAAYARQAGVHRRALPEDGAAAPGHLGDEQPCLPHDGAGDRRRKRGREEAFLVVEPAQVVHPAHAEQHDHDDGQRAERRAVRSGRPWRSSTCRAPIGSACRARTGSRRPPRR